MNRLVACATAMPRPAKLARQTSQFTMGQVFCGRGLQTPSLTVLRALQDCRAGFAGRDRQVVRATEGSTLASGADPRRSLGSAF
jgi:hypothetical protein